jgi:hypothetical protein
MNDLDWKMPALIGGLLTGVLSVIPVVNFVNCCFCGWALVGGALATKLLVDRTPRPLRGGDGARIGLMSGLIAAGIYLLINIPLILTGIAENFQYRMMGRIADSANNPELQEWIRRIIEESARRTMAEKFFSSLLVLIPLSILLGGFTVLGGLLGVALFEKRKNLPPPPPYPTQPETQPPWQYPPQSGS